MQNLEDKTFEGIKAEQEFIGYYNLPNNETTKIKSYAEKITKKNIVIIGIGGSSLGPSAIYEFLKYKKNFKKKLHFLESTDPLSLQYKIDRIDLSDSLFVVISKSGGTIETISILKYILTKVPLQKENFVLITEEDSNLKAFGDTQNLDSFIIPKNVGGRFSVFCPVGLLPLALVGVDIDQLLLGAKEVRDSFFNKSEYYQKLMPKALLFSSLIDTQNINCLFSYSETLREFNRWYVQIWGESLGKQQPLTDKNIGLTPIGLVGPVDQHSFLQLIVEGFRDKTVTFIKIKDFENEIKIGNISLENLEALDNINGLEFSKLINMQCDSIINSLKDLKEIPIDVLELEKIDERNIGKLMFYFEVLTSLVGKILNVNTYNQPGVEDGKILLKKMLNKI